MPVANCCVVGCPTYASKDKYPALSFFKIPKGKKHEEWRSQLIRIVNRIDKSFNPGNAFICSRHFKESCYKTGTYLNSFKQLQYSLYLEVFLKIFES